MNSGWTYRDRIGAQDAGTPAISYYAERYRHSDETVWRRRMERGEILRGGERLAPEDILGAGDELEWTRPPWEEPPVRLILPVLYEDHAVLAVDNRRAPRRCEWALPSKILGPHYATIVVKMAFLVSRASAWS